MQNLLKVLTTKRERRLGRMQANKNTVSYIEKKTSQRPQSFDCDEKYLEDLIAQGTSLQLSAHEQRLIEGISKPQRDERSFDMPGLVDGDISK